MELGFETIGNATLICHDRGPLLVTDPWLVGAAYFGSWIHQHEIPEQQLQAIRDTRYVWISHGHPDHLSLESLELLRDKDILIPDHYGERVARELKAAGFRVWTVKDGLWIQISDRVRILTICDVYQDATLLVDFDGTLVVNANDAADRGGGAFVVEQVRKARRSYLLALIGYGDADMINMFDEQGARIPPPGAAHQDLGPGVLEVLTHLEIDTYVPFSTLHRYQRTDSAWVNEHITQPADFARGFRSETKSILPAYSRVDLVRDDVTEIRPKAHSGALVAPEAFGDNWSDELGPKDVAKLQTYFARFEHLPKAIGFVNFKVGGRDNRIAIPGAAAHLAERGVTFETPRASLMTCVEYEIFDDLLIGNFTRTTLHGAWASRGVEGLYPEVNPFVTKYGDNGGAHTAQELRAYFAEYKRRGFFSFRDNPSQLAEQRELSSYL